MSGWGDTATRLRFRAYGRIFDNAKRVLQSVGGTNFTTTFETVVKDRDAIDLLDAWIHDTSRLGALTFTVVSDDKWLGNAPPPALVTHIVELMGLKVAVAAKAEMDVIPEGSLTHWSSRSLEPAGTRLLEDEGESYDQFVEDAKRTTGIHDLVVRALADPPPLAPPP